MKYLVLAAILFSSLAQAGAPEMHDFFGYLKGEWRGEGTRVTTPFDGQKSETPFDFQIIVNTLGRTQDGDPLWSVNTQWDAQDGNRHEQGKMEFTTRKGRALRKNWGVVDAPMILEWTENRLSYQLKRVDSLGRQWVYTYTWEVTTPGILDGTESSALDGITMSQDSFRLRRW